MSSRRLRGGAPDGASGGGQPPVKQERGTAQPAPPAQPEPRAAGMFIGSPSRIDSAHTTTFSEWLGHVVVADLAEFYLVIGTLVEVRDDWLVFVDADLHDHREANSTKEVYCLETRQLGVRVNRRQVAVPRRQIVALSRLADVVA